MRPSYFSRCNVAGPRALRAGLLATTLGIFLPLATATPAAAAKVDGIFSGGARSIAVSGITGSLSLSLHNSASAGCPCKGTHGVVIEKTTSSIDVPGIMSVQATVATAYGSNTHNTATTSQSSTITGLNLLGGLITADALVSMATVNATPTELTRSDDGSTFTNLVINGTPIDPNVPDNTVIELEGLGTVTVKEVDAGRNAQQAHENVEMLVVDVTKTNSLDLPVGAKLVIGVAKAGYDRQEPQASLSGGGTGLIANADAGAALDEAAGSAASIGIPGCSGTDGKTLTKSVTDLDAAGLLTIGTITNTATGTEGKTSVANTSSTASNVSLLGGLITVSSIEAFAQESITGDVDTPSTVGSGFVGLSIGGLPVDPSLPPNTTLALPGFGSVVVNEQLMDAKSVHVNGLHIKVTQQNVLGLTPGAQIIVAHAAASARKF